MALRSAAGGLLEWITVAAKLNYIRGENHIMNDKDSYHSNHNVSSSKSSSGGEWTTSVIQAALNGLSSPSAGSTEGSQIPQWGWLEEKARQIIYWVLEDGVGLDLHNPSPVTKNLRLVTSPVPAVSCIFLYIIIVWLWSSQIKKSGQKPIKEDPLPLRFLVIVHNLFLCMLSLFMGTGLLVLARQHGLVIPSFA
jgi:hypothetical protein